MGLQFYDVDIEHKYTARTSVQVFCADEEEAERTALMMYDSAKGVAEDLTHDETETFITALGTEE
jgi:hypothetical protein